MYASFYETEFIQISLKTDSETVAANRASILNNELENIWGQITTLDPLEKDQLLSQAVTMARMSGFIYRPAAEISERNIGSIISRINAIKDSVDDNPDKVHAILGRHDRIEFPISKILEDFFEFEKQNLINKSSNQIRKWKNPRKRAVANFIKVLGDLEIPQITRDDILTFRGWWHDRIRSEGLNANSSNKGFSHIRQILIYAKDDKRIDIDVTSLLARVRFTETISTRPPFPTDFIKNTLLDSNNLHELNSECRYFLFAMADNRLFEVDSS